MARRRNFLTFAAMDIATLSCRQRISFRDLIAYPVGRISANSQNSDKRCKTVSSCSPHRRHTIVAGQPCNARSGRRRVCLALARKFCSAVAPVQML
ncbi:hypothetical protein PoB_006731500 [Plakobranchus ocellatus]|uniref:Twin-arginine translocation signal domain-containing protein n=1 Tax=Plakobranchus ocellatus TaxID=259542 RepID=A0AAV4D9L5_9GAST|nr:hypothetical protein PoB_006731500 [Plakobranchus ocellatus]